MADLTTERNILSAVLTESPLWEHLSGLTVKSFEDSFCRKVFSAMSETVKNGLAIDILAVDRLVNDTPALMELQGECVNPSNLPSWVMAVKESETRRVMSRQFGKTLQNLQNGVPVGPELDNIVRVTERAIGYIGASKVKELDAVSKEVLEQLAAGSMESVPYFPDGTPASRAVQHHRREMHLICAGTGTGKTALACGAALEQLKRGLKVLYFCTESTTAAIFQRLAAAVCGVPHFSVMESADNVTATKSAMDFLRESYAGRLFIRGCDSRIRTAEAMRSEARRIAARFGEPDVVYVDFIQNVAPPDGMERKSKNDQLTYISDRLNELFIEMNAAGIVLSQLNREAGKDENKKPGMEHVKDCGTMSELASIVSFLWREKLQDKYTGNAYFFSKKERNCRRFYERLAWNRTKYESVSKYTAQDNPKRV